MSFVLAHGQLNRLRKHCQRKADLTIWIILRLIKRQSENCTLLDCFWNDWQLLIWWSAHISLQRCMVQTTVVGALPCRTSPQNSADQICSSDLDEFLSDLVVTWLALEYMRMLYVTKEPCFRRWLSGLGEPFPSWSDSGFSTIQCGRCFQALSLQKLLGSSWRFYCFSDFFRYVDNSRCLRQVLEVLKHTNNLFFS